MTDIGHDPVQLDFFDLFGPPPTIQLPPCGRGGPCEAVVERDRIRCVTCDCVGPRPSAPARTIFDDFIQSQLKFLRSR
jgi:hypothetical protein